MFKGELIGNLGADAEVKESNGSKFVTMRVAHSESWKDESGEKKERTTWVDVIMNDAESKLLPYLKQGVKLFVRGNMSLRVYSSPKDRMMKAGATINAWEIELLGGSNESVPKQIVDPADGRIYDVQKLYWIERDNKAMTKNETYTMVDARGNHFLMNKVGFVKPFVPEETKGE